MLHLVVNRQELLYDLYALTQAFYPGIEIVSHNGKCGDDHGDNLYKENHPEENDNEENSCKDSFGVKDFHKDTLEVSLYEDSGKIVITKGEIFSHGLLKEYTDQEIMKEAEVFLKAEMDTAAARKRALKNLFYDAMSEYTGKKLPWGNLTGIRPTKLIRTLMQQYGEPEKLSEQIYGMHRLQGEKLQLGIEIAGLQNDILSELHGLSGYSVYVGIPFCPSRCLYCSFTSNPVDKWKKRIPEYLAALRKELEYTAASPYAKMRTLDTVYVGGGTPTALSAEELDVLLRDITTILPMEQVKEFTVEAGRADSITEDKLEILKKYHVTRISVNPQTMKEETLKTIGRKHTVDDVYRAYDMARKAGFDNVNMDIILGLPGETAEDVAYTIEKIVKMAPDSLTVHSLAVKRAAGLKDRYDSEGDPRAQGGDQVQIMMERAMEISSKGARQMGMKPYYLYRQKNMAGNLENTGYSLPGKYGLYNILIMEELQSIIALGAGSVSKRVDPDGRIERCDNVKDIRLYLDKIEEMIGRKRVLFAELSEEELLNKNIISPK